MHDIYIFLLYEIVINCRDIWIPIMFYILNVFKLRLFKFLYIPLKKELNLEKVLILYDNTVIFCDYINLNYYHIKYFLNNRILTIKGNQKYISVNNIFFKYNVSNNSYTSNYVTMYKLPIKIYDQEDCCICYENSGSLIGICGHQNVCISCMEYINNCPNCNMKLNYKSINPNLLNKILYI